MEIELTSRDRRRIEKSIRGKYAKVAASPEGLFKYPTGRAGLEALNYHSEIIQTLPEDVASSYCGGTGFLALIQQAGFRDSEMIGETVFNSSPVTKGLLIRATK